MREIKFRAWNVKCKIMHYHKDYWRYLDFAGNLYTSAEYGIQPWTEDTILMQYTGLKDKNGKEIYEGDIVKTTVAHKTSQNTLDLNVPSDIKIFAVEWQEFSTGFNLIRTSINTYEVIGNIYENSELLKKEKP